MSIKRFNPTRTSGGFSACHVGPVHRTSLVARAACPCGLTWSFGGGRRMYRFSSKLGVWNSRKAPQVVAVEPWANDYTLLPDEKLEIVAFGEAAVPWFNVVEWDGTTQVYCEDTVDFKVLQGDRELECGHQRQS